MRAIACLPALTGAWRDPAGGGLLSSSGTYPVDSAALERPDLIRGKPRTINMSAIGDALLDADDPPIRALYVYNSNPVAVAPESAKVAAGFAREDLFCVVHEIFQTDTADYADILLPATTQLEHDDVHNSYGHLYALANNPAIAPLGEAKPNTEVFRLLAARMGFDEPCFRDSDDDLARQAFKASAPARGGPRLGQPAARRRASQRLAVPDVLRAVRARQLPHAVRQVRILLRDARRPGPRPAADVRAAARIGRDQSRARAALSAGVHVAARAQLPELVVRQPAALRRRGKDAEARHPSRRRRRAAHRDGDVVRIFNDRGSFTATARVTDRARPASWSRRRSGGRSSRRTAPTRTR